MVKTPFSNSAFALSEITPTGSATERSNEPQRCSRMCHALSFCSSSCLVSPRRVSTSPVTLICTSSGLKPGRAALTTTSSSVWYRSMAGEDADQVDPPFLPEENGRVKVSSNRRSIASRRLIISRVGSQRLKLDIANTSLQKIEYYFLRPYI